jgi:hypothetical protein
MKKPKRTTRVEPPGNGLELDLPILTDTVLELAYGEETPVADFKKRLRKGGRDYYKRLHDVILECLEDEALVQAELDRYFAFVDELIRLNVPAEDGRPLAFERWLAAAVGAYIDEYGLQDERRRFLYDTECWGLVPPDSAEKECGVPLTRVGLAKAMSELVDVPLDRRERVESGNNDLFPFQPKGNDLGPDADGVMMLRRLGIIPEEWDQIYGEIVERLADDFSRRFYPALRSILLDPDEVKLFYGERVQMELLPGFGELFATLLQDVLTVATNQVLRHADGEGPGTGPGMREFAWTTTHRDQQNSKTAIGHNWKPGGKQQGPKAPRSSKKPKGRNGIRK